MEPDELGRFGFNVQVKTCIRKWLFAFFVQFVVEIGKICLRTLLLLFEFANHRNKRPFVSTANEARLAH